jgi:hypothetical protein
LLKLSEKNRGESTRSNPAPVPASTPMRLELKRTSTKIKKATKTGPGRRCACIAGIQPNRFQNSVHDQADNVGVSGHMVCQGYGGALALRGCGSLSAGSAEPSSAASTSMCEDVNAFSMRSPNAYWLGLSQVGP